MLRWYVVLEENSHVFIEFFFYIIFCYFIHMPGLLLVIEIMLNGVFICKMPRHLSLRIM